MTPPPFVPPPLHEFQFESRVPILGPLISGVRRLWHSIAGRWALRWLAGQQEGINAAVAERLNAAAQAGQVHDSRIAELEARQRALFDTLRTHIGQYETEKGRLAASHAQLTDLIHSLQQERAGQQAANAETATRLEQRLDALAEAVAADATHLAQLQTATQCHLQEIGQELGEMAGRIGGLRQEDAA